MAACRVSTDRYWNFIATPLLFSVVGFGSYVLLTAGEEYLTDKVKGRARGATTTDVSPAAAAATPAAATPAAATPAAAAATPADRDPAAALPGSGARGRTQGTTPPQTTRAARTTPQTTRAARTTPPGRRPWRG